MDKIKIITILNDPKAKEAARIAEERINEIDFDCFPLGQTIEISFRAQAQDGFMLLIDHAQITICADKIRGYIAGVGELLNQIRKSADTKEDISDFAVQEVPRYPIRVHYMPAHFGNTFENSWPSERQRYLEDLALAGASGYGDWFNPYDMPDPYNPHVFCSISMALWARKKEFLKTAKRLGLDTMLWVAHNVGYVDQMRPEWIGRRSHEHRVQGQVLCPSIPQARNVCLQNHKNLFCDLLQSGVEIDKVCFGPYDDGGCACENCQPYYPTFLSMVTEIIEIIKQYYPTIKGDICGWWASDEEINQLKAYTVTTAKDWFLSFQFSVTYHVFAVPEDIRSKIGNTPLSTFMHIGFSHDNRDVYYKTGIHSAPKRIQSILSSFDKVECLGFHTYNESFGDHFNEYISTRLSCNPDLNIRDITLDYCRGMYQLKGSELNTITDVLLEMEFLENEKAELWVRKLRALKPNIKTPFYMDWAYEHILIKAELMALDYKIESEAIWTSVESIQPMLPIIQKRFQMHEKLYRDCYQLSITRHAFIPSKMVPNWYNAYEKLYPTNNGRIIPGSLLSANA